MLQVRLLLLSSAALLAGVILCGSARAALQVSADFPGGAAEVVSIDQKDRKIVFKIPTQKNGGWASWWYLKVTGIEPGEVVRLELTNGQAHARRAVYSLDQKTWHFTPLTTTIQKDGKTSTLYAQKIDGKEAWFAWYVPFLPANSEPVIDRAVKACPHAKKFELCKSEGDIPVVGVRFAEPGVQEAQRYGIWVHARQHAWEAGSSWTAQGLIEWLSSDDPRAADLRKKANISVVPIMDVDSVAQGMGGKNQKPHDHNRDWHDKPIWKAVQSAMSEIRTMNEAGKLDLFLDLHDPGWTGGFDFWCHMYEEMGPTRRKNTDAFMVAAKAEVVGPLRCLGNVVDSYPITTPTSGIWACKHTRETVVGGTFEIGVYPRASYDGKPIEHHLLAGKQLGLAIERYFRAEVRKTKP